MCGRFGLTKPRGLAEEALASALAIDDVGPAVPDPLPPRYNIAPSQPVLVVRERAARDGRPRQRRLDMVRWGLVPSWAKDPSIGHRLANARAESAFEKPAFRTPLVKGRRCLVLADVFYEWQGLDGAPPADTPDGRQYDDATQGTVPTRRSKRGTKQPWAIAMADEAPFAFAGLWDAWRAPDAPADEGPTVTCTLFTTAPNALMRTIHDRMPVIVPRAAYDAWLDPSTTPDALRALLAPYDAAAMRAWPVSTWVNDPVHDDERCVAPLASA